MSLSEEGLSSQCALQPLSGSAVSISLGLGKEQAGCGLMQVPGTSGTLALVVMPRYVLRNSLGPAVQYRQQETLLEKELAPGASRPLRSVLSLEHTDPHLWLFDL